jgi:DamX protein
MTQIPDKAVTAAEQPGQTTGSTSGVAGNSVFFPEPQRLQCLNFLLHLAPYTSAVLMVMGDEGSGKTTLLNQFVAKAGDSWRIAVVPASADLTETGFLAALSEAFSPVPAPPDATIEARLDMLLEQCRPLHKSGHRIIVAIDDAHLLRDENFLVLEQLLGRVHDAGLYFSVILAAQSELADRPSIRLMRRFGIHMFELTPLVYDEARKYMEHYLAINGLPADTLSAARMIRIFKQSEGNIAAINQLIGKPDRPAPAVASRPAPAVEAPQRPAGGGRGRAMKYVAGALLAVGLVLAVVFQSRINLFFEQPASTDVANLEQPPVSAQQAGGQPATEGAGMNEVQVIADAEPEQPAVPEAIEETSVEESRAGLPDEPVPGRAAAPSEDVADEELLTARFSDEEIRAIDEIDTLLSMDMDGQEDAGPAAPEETISSPGQETASPGVIDIRVEEEPEVAARAEVTMEADASALPAVATTAPVGLQGADWLLNQDPDRYTLQLMALRDEAALLDLFRDVEAGQPLAHFQTLRRDEVFHAMVYGSFASRAEAEAAQLPPGIGRITPWIRKFRGVQRDIDKTRAFLGEQP